MDTTKEMKPLEELPPLERLLSYQDYLIDEGHPEMSYTGHMMKPEEWKFYSQGIMYAIRGLEKLIEAEKNAERSAEEGLQDDKGSESHREGSGSPSSLDQGGEWLCYPGDV